MNLVRWFRKNNKKVMAVVVIVIMFGFVGGSYISQLGRRRTGLHKTAAWLGDNKKITNYDLVLAQRELEILRGLRADVLLNSQDLRAILLSELLFSERRTSPALINRIKQVIRTNEYRISNKQINDIYKKGTVGSNIYWLLLKSEVEQGGIRISNENSGNLLARIIPQLFDRATYSQLIRSLMNQQGIPEKQILTTFSKLLAVLEYSMVVCSAEDVTTQQIMHNVSLENETIDVEFVKFDSAVFAETQAEPTQQEISEHFDKYKKFFAGAVSEENPYGFGYKLADRVGLEYIAVKLDDISGIVTPPTQQESEEYYQKHREQYTEQVPLDPNDPNSALIERLRSYAEVANSISSQILQNKINSKAERMLQEAKTLTEAGFEDTGTAAQNLGVEPSRLAGMAGDYETAAKDLSKKHKAKVYTGQTGLLSASDIRMDKHLGMLYLTGSGETLVGLPQIVFAIDELGVSELGPFDIAKPRMYENIGPMKDVLGQIMVVLRVIEAEKTSEPKSINQTFSKSTLRFEQTEEQAGDDVYSVKENVTEDLKKLAAMDTTKSKAEEFIKQVVKDGWNGATEKFNELYGQTEKADGEPNVFKIESFTNLRRMSRETIGTLAVQNAGDPAGQFLINTHKKEAQLIYRLYSLVPQDRDTVETVPLIMEFKPDISYYVIKEISVKPLSKEEYEKIKAQQAYKEDIIQSQSLAAVHFSPENVLKRMNFRWVEQERQTTDANTPVPIDSIGKGAS